MTAAGAELRLENVTVSYGGVLDALADVSMRIGGGEAIALLGANGAGKTTLLRAISGNLRRHRARIAAGSVLLDGESLVGLPMSTIVRRGVVQVPEGRRIFGKLTVEENLRIGGVPRRNAAALAETRDRVYELFPVLAERRAQPGTLLSGGEQQMLAIGRALMAGPRLLMLDEPSLGLAPMIVERIGEVIRGINDAGTTVLLIEQNANMALSVVDRAYVFELGRVRLQGTSAELLQSDEIKHLFLGHGTDRSDERLSAPVITKTLSRWEGR